MMHSISTVIIFLVLLAMVPGLFKWMQRRQGKTVAVTDGAIKIVSAQTIGPQQRILTVEVGPPSARSWLVLGITAQQIHCLHSTPLHALIPLDEAARAHAGDHPYKPAGISERAS